MKKIVIMVLILSISLFSGCKKDDTTKSESSEVFVMDTYVTQTVYGVNRNKAILNVNKTLRKLEKNLSLYIAGSDIDKINNNAGLLPVKVDSYTYDIIYKSYVYSENSDGIFDITIAPLSKLWGITSENPKVPAEEQINQALKLIDYKKIEFNKKENSIFLKDKNMAIDLGGIAKGYICDVIKQEYDSLNVDSALVSIGGNIFAYKTKPGNKAYTLGIRDPYGESNDIIGKLNATNKVVATTGAYERFFESEGKIYHHILNTKSGYPVDSAVASATIVSEDGGLADFLSTTIFIEGIDGIEKYKNLGNFEFIVIYENKDVVVSEGLVSDFSITNKDYDIINGE